MYIQVPVDPASTRSSLTMERFLGETPATGAASSPPGQEMTCRLLCASNVTYDTTLNPLSPYYKRAGFPGLPATLERAAPANLVGGRRKIDACLIGSLQGSSANPADRGVVLAFRGTLTGTATGADIADTLSDWLNDFEAPLVPFKGYLGTLTPGIRAHKGFADSVENLLDPSAKTTTGRTVVDEIKSRLAAIPGGRLFITGHSKGAAMAYLAGLLLHRMGIGPCVVVSFEAPRPGDQTFANAFNASGIYAERHEFQDDIVPHVPPSGILGRMLSGVLSFDARAAALLSVLYPRAVHSANYVSPGTLHFIDWNNNLIIGDTAALQTQRLARLVAMVSTAAKAAILESAKIPSPAGSRPIVAIPLYFRNLFATLAAMHAIDCNSGTMKRLCSPAVCP